MHAGRGAAAGRECALVLVDATSNTVLASGNADERVEPASLTKLMTAYLVFEALDKKKISMEQIVTPSEAVRRVGRDESRMFIEANKPVSVHDLVYGMIIQSATTPRSRWPNSSAAAKGSSSR